MLILGLLSRNTRPAIAPRLAATQMDDLALISVLLSLPTMAASGWRALSGFGASLKAAGEMDGTFGISASMLTKQLFEQGKLASSDIENQMGQSYLVRRHLNRQYRSVLHVIPSLLGVRAGEQPTVEVKSKIKVRRLKSCMSEMSEKQ